MKMINLLVFWFIGYLTATVYDLYITPYPIMDSVLDNALITQDPIGYTILSLPYFVIVLVKHFAMLLFWWVLPFRIYADFFMK
jgi:hypothetical protein